jgi:hypothetical protein
MLPAAKADGALLGWPDQWLPMPGKPLVLDRPQDWTGPEDCSISIQVVRDDKQLYLGAKVADERIIDGKDAVTFLCDVRPLADRRDDPRLRKGTFRVTASPGGGAASIEGLSEAADPKSHYSEVNLVPGGYQVKVSLPLETISEFQKDPHSIQLTAVVTDVDEAGQPPARVLWRGTSDVSTRNTNFGQFVLAP